MIEPRMKTPPADISSAVTDKYTEAYNLNVRIITSAQAAQMSLYEVCKGLKQMHDSKLYKELGYSSFESYCEEEVGIKRHMALHYIKVAKNGELIHHFENIGVTKLSLLCDLSEEQRTEITQNVDVEEVSVRQLKEEIERLKSEKERSKESYEAAIRDWKARCKLADEKYEKSLDEAIELEERIKELENRPIDVAVESDTHEVENMRKAMAKLSIEHETAMAKIQDDNFRDIRRLNDEHNEAVEKLKAEYEKKLSELPKAGSEPDTKEIFKAYLSSAVDTAKRLVAFLRDNPDAELYKTKTREFFSTMIKEVS